MVLGITLRRRKTKDDGPIHFKPSPSLPNITPSGLSPADWPTDLIDMKKVQEEISEDAVAEEDGKPSSPYKSTFQSPFSSPSQNPPSFHRPFRPQPANDMLGEGRSEDAPGRPSIA